MQGRASALVFGDREDPRKRLAELFGGDVPEAAQPPQPAMDWAADLLRGTAGRQITTQLEAIRLFRAAEPRLGLKPATFLAKNALAAR
ncbi:hypothetical protein [Microbacterium sp.]|uniref:hypothetical protein n=1 Tax=Microbacterium sp. TaxID=51671 RepID=UPI0039E51158